MVVAQLVEPRIVIPVVVGSSPINHPRICGRGEIGRRTGFRFQRVKLWEFESPRPHQYKIKYNQIRSKKPYIIYITQSIAINIIKYHLTKSKTKWYTFIIVPIL